LYSAEKQQILQIAAISGFRGSSFEGSRLLGSSAMSSGKGLPTFSEVFSASITGAMNTLLHNPEGSHLDNANVPSLTSPVFNVFRFLLGVADCDQTKECELRGTCDAHGEYYKYIQNFIWENLK
jgi:hypothetical protein